MTKRPIPFSAEMVRAILKGDKTQTRRVIKPQPAPFVQSTPNRHPTTRTDPYIDAYCGERKTPENPRGMSRDWHWWTADNRLGRLVARCPYGAPGDLLWVRETWAGHASGVDYAADFAAVSRPQAGPWRSPIHMPRWASRITLRITDVRVKRLQDISCADAEAEGLTKEIAPNGHVTWHVPDLLGAQTPCRAFRLLWEGINGAGAWDANPWVWVLSFERVKP